MPLYWLLKLLRLELQLKLYVDIGTYRQRIWLVSDAEFYADWHEVHVQRINVRRESRRLCIALNTRCGIRAIIVIVFLRPWRESRITLMLYFMMSLAILQNQTWINEVRDRGRVKRALFINLIANIWLICDKIHANCEALMNPEVNKRY